MRIGILTQPLRNNYGCLLQNYALQTVLKRLGHEVSTIDWDGRFTIKERIWRFLMRFRKYVKSSSPICLKYIPTTKEEFIISENTNRFIIKYITHTRTAYTKRMLYRRAMGINAQAYIVGSDQVWRPGYNAFPMAMFLEFVKDNTIKRIAYAASFGSDKWGYSTKITELIKPLASKFDLITVRESTGIGLCKNYLGVEAIHVLDPTMLLSKEDYIRIVEEEKEPKSEGNLFHYILDPSDEKSALINEIAKRGSLIPFSIMPKCQAENRTKWDVKHRIEDCVFPSVTSWLRGFMDAEIVIIDSFHGAVFSIIFNKPFWVIGNKKRGNARFESLLESFGLEDRMIVPGQEIDWNAPIDWVRVNKIRERGKERSIELLQKELNK